MVCNAYLVCRIADTIEDEPALSAARKEAFLERFAGVVAGRESAESFARELRPFLSPATHASERDLVANTGRVVRITRGFHAIQRNAIERCVRIMARGMAGFFNTWRRLQAWTTFHNSTVTATMSPGWSARR